MDDVSLVLLVLLMFMALLLFLWYVSRPPTVTSAPLYTATIPPLVTPIGVPPYVQPSVGLSPVAPAAVSPAPVAAPTSPYLALAPPRTTFVPELIRPVGPSVPVFGFHPSTTPIGLPGFPTAPVVTSRESLPSPSPSADLETVLNYLLARGGTLDGVAYSSGMRTALLTTTHWTSSGKGWRYEKGLNTQSSYLAYPDSASGMWNIRGISS